MRIVIIGGSDAGIAAALRARELDPGVDVTVFLADAYPNFSICGLPYLLGGEVASVDHLAHRTDFPGIDIRTNHLVRRIDAEAKVVAVEHAGATSLQSFDKLIVATGARPAFPDIAGIDRPGVFPLHTIDDGLAIGRYLDTHAPKRAVIVGAGYIGLEMAEALRLRGLEVTLLSRSLHVMPTLDASLGDLLAAELERNGVKVVLGAGAASIGDDLGVTDTLKHRHDADLVLLATGVRPDTTLAAAAGAKLGLNDAIVVSRDMRTSLPSVFAAGDCVLTHHRMRRDPTWISLGTIAHKQGRVAGENALGLGTSFAGIIGTQCLKLFGLAAARTGLLDIEAEAEGFHPLSVEVTADDHKAYYPGAVPLRIRLTGDRRTHRLLSIQIVGPYGAEISKRIDIAAALLFWDGLVERLVELDLSYSPPLSSPWDPIQIAAHAWQREIERLTSPKLRRQDQRKSNLVHAQNLKYQHTNPPIDNDRIASLVSGPLYLITIPVAYAPLRKWSRSAKIFERRWHVDDVIAARAALSRHVPGLHVGALEIRRKTSGRGVVHCYVAGEQHALMSQLKAASDALLLAGLTSNEAEVSPIRTFEVGDRISFRLRLRPVEPRGEPKTDLERQLALTDVYALADIAEGVQGDQFTVYRDWFSGQLASAAVLSSFSVLRLDEKIVWVRTATKDASPRKGPDVLVEATAVVKDSDHFTRLVLIGVGECVEWGFGFMRFAEEASDLIAKDIR